MKRITLLLILISFYSIGKSQVVQEQGVAGVQYKVGKFDSATIITRGDTICRSLNKPCLGSIVFRNIGGDSTTYIHNGTRWQKILGATSGISGKLNISDTAAMLSSYLRKADTTGKWVNKIMLNTTGDSIVYYIGTTRYAVKYNSGTLNGSDTVALSNRINNRWTLTGNASTDSATNFIGTTDAKPLTFATNGIVRGIINSGTGNVGIGTTTPTEKLDVDGTIKVHEDIKLEGLTGVTAQLSQPSGGKLSLYDPVGVENITIEGTAGTIEAAGGITFSGLSLSDTTTVKPIGATTGGGLRRLAYWPSGGGSQWTTSGNDIYNNNIGKVHVKQNLQADSGFYLLNSTSGIGGNIYKGGSLWMHNRGDASNISLGFGTGTNGTGSNNTAIGQSSFASNTTGTRNIAIGLQAMNVGTNLYNSVAIGWEAMRYATNTTDGTVTNTIAIGASALANVRTGYSNIAIGKLSLTEFLDGTGNAIVGASNRLQSGTFNSGIGSDAMSVNLMNGNYNSFVGGYSMSAKKSGSYNTAIGNHTLSSDSTGSYNTMLGSYAGSNNNGSYNTFLGNFAGAYETNRNHTIIIDGDWSPSAGMKYTIVGQAHDKKIAINKTTGEMDANPENFQVGGSVRLDSTVRLDKADIAIAPSTRWKLALDTATGKIVRDSVSGGAAIDTANKWVNTITRVAGKDSIIFYVGTTRFAIKDSSGGTGSSQWTTDGGSIYYTGRVAMGTSTTSSTVGLIVKGVGSGYDNVAEFRNSSNTLLAKVREDGYLLATTIIDDQQKASLNSAGVAVGGASIMGFSNNVYAWETLDAGVSRTAAATLAVGNGTAGNTTGTILAARALSKQGADVASTAGAMTLGTDGTTFEITGTNSITLLSNVGWVNGNEVTLLFTGAATLVNGTATSGTNIIMKLAGAVDFVASADDTITLVLSEIGGTQAWREKCRSVN